MPNRIAVTCIRDITDSRLQVVAVAGESRLVSPARAQQLLASGCFAAVPQVAPPVAPPPALAPAAQKTPRRPKKLPDLLDGEAASTCLP